MIKVIKKYKKSKYKVQKAHVAALARPRLVTKPYAPQPKPAVRPAALQAKCPARTKILSAPLQRKSPDYHDNNEIKKEKIVLSKEPTKAKRKSKTKEVKWVVKSVVPRQTCEHCKCPCNQKQTVKARA